MRHPTPVAFKDLEDEAKKLKDELNKRLAELADYREAFEDTNDCRCDDHACWCLCHEFGVAPCSMLREGIAKQWAKAIRQSKGLRG